MTLKHLPRNSVLFGLLYGLSEFACAQPIITVEEALMHCKAAYAASTDTEKRLACYDSIETSNIVTRSHVNAAETKPSGPAIKIAVESEQPEFSYLEKKWRLSSEGDWNITDFETHRANYLLMQFTDDVNNRPASPDFPVTDDRSLQSKDLQFQFSLKTELFKNIPWIKTLPYVTSSRLWAAYTQQSYWQILNAKDSRPLRENDYQPELILSLGIDNHVAGQQVRAIPRLLNIGLVHESNGREDPLSRSWNRVYLEGGWELTDQLSLMVRPWWRIPENGKNDDNPDIERYLGYGDMTFRWENDSNKTAATLLLRNNLRSDNKGYAKLDLSRKLYEDSTIKMHFMLSNGYGDSLLDYNHAQSTIGLGLSLGD